MNIYNVIKCKFIIISALSLFTGLLIYIFLREGTFIHSALPFEVRSVAYELYKNSGNNLLADFLRYYLADFLWCFSLNFALFTVVDLKNRKMPFVLSTISALAGIFFEFAQYFNFASGTFDFADIVMYIVASVLAVAINIKILKRTV